MVPCGVAQADRHDLSDRGHDASTEQSSVVPLSGPRRPRSKAPSTGQLLSDHIIVSDMRSWLHTEEMAENVASCEELLPVGALHATMRDMRWRTKGKDFGELEQIDSDQPG